MRQWFEGVDEAVAGGEEDEVSSVNNAEGGRGPGAVENVRGDVFVLAGEELARAFVEDDEARGVGRADAFVGVVHAGAGVEVKMVAANEDGAVGGVVGPDACLLREVEEPEDVGVEGAGGEQAGRLLHYQARLGQPAHDGAKKLRGAA